VLVAAEAPHRLGDHGADRLRLAEAAGDLGRAEPVETPLAVVLQRLRRQRQAQTNAVGQRHPAGLGSESGGVLAATMQQHNQRRACREAGRTIGEHGQAGGIRGEIRHRDQLSGGGRGDAAPGNIVPSDIARRGRGNHRGSRPQRGAQPAPGGPQVS